MLFSLATAAEAFYWAVDLVQHYGLAPADGGVLAPPWQRAAWGVFVAVFGAAFDLRCGAVHIKDRRCGSSSTCREIEGEASETASRLRSAGS